MISYNVKHIRFHKLLLQMAFFLIRIVNLCFFFIEHILN